jgi:hypothetical protein
MQIDDIGIFIISNFRGVFELISQGNEDAVKYDACRHPFRTSSVVRIGPDIDWKLCETSEPRRDYTIGVFYL